MLTRTVPGRQCTSTRREVPPRAVIGAGERVGETSEEHVEIRAGDDILGLTQYWSSDTPLLSDLPPDTLARVRSTVIEGLWETIASCEYVVVEGSGSVGETPLDLPNRIVAASAPGPIVLAANVRRGGFLSALAGAGHVLGPTLKERVAGTILTNASRTMDRRAVADFVAARTRIPVLAMISPPTGWNHGPLRDCVLDDIASELEPAITELRAADHLP